MIDHFIESKNCPEIFSRDLEILQSVSLYMSIEWNDIRSLGKKFTSNFSITKQDGRIALSGAICPKFMSMSVYDGELFAEFAVIIATLVPQHCELVLYDESLGQPIIDLKPTTLRETILTNFGFAHGL